MSKTERVIVSLTTTSSRVRLLYYAFKSLLEQSVRPDILMVNLSKESWLADNGFDSLPLWLIRSRVMVQFVPNIGSYRKLLPALEIANDNDLIVTADDDVIYSQTWLEDLLKLAQEEPQAIASCRARKMEKNLLGCWCNYGRWILIDKKVKGVEILPTGGAGAVYRKHLLNVNFVKDHEFLKIAPTTDDLWFRMASLLRDVPVIVEPKIDANNIYMRHEFGLEKTNLRKSLSHKIPGGLGRRYIDWFIDYLGIAQTANDRAWRMICLYARKYGWQGP